MEDLLRPIYQERASHPNTLGIIMIEKAMNTISVIDTFDTVILVVVKDSEDTISIKHYAFENQKASLHIIEEKKLKEWLLFGSNRKISEWTLNGKILFDRNEYITKLKLEFQEFPFNDRQKKIGIEFAKLIRRYQDGRVFLGQRNYLDAYNNVVHALHHLARLAVIENGFHPEVTVWNQVRQIEPQIHKLYEELIESEESLEKRLELLFLASDFLINSKASVGGNHLLTVMACSNELWSFGELAKHPELELYSVDLEVLLEYLVEKQLIVVNKVETKGVGIFHRKYVVSNKNNIVRI